MSQRRHAIIDTPGTRAGRDQRDPVDPMLYARLFESPEGQQVLAELERVFVSSAVTEGGIDAVLKTYQRAGQRSVIEFIILKINRANGAADEE